MSFRGYEVMDGKLDCVLDEVSAESQDELHATLDEKERDGFQSRYRLMRERESLQSGSGDWRSFNLASR